MDKPDLTEARWWLSANGRLLERRMFAALFEGADADGALDALRAYRNPDGGFGHGLEPDKRVPDSQPLDVEIAFQSMDVLGRVDSDLVAGACGFLDRLGAGVALLTAAYREHPRAPHFEDWALLPSLNPTAGIAALLWRWGVAHPWRELATSFCWQQIESGLPADAHGFGEVLSFLAWCPERERADRLTAALAERIASLEMFRLDPAAPGYGLTPLHFAPSPDSRWIGLFEPAVVEAHLDALAAAQRDDGGWPISWETLSAAAEADCRGMETLRALRTLSAFGRLSPLRRGEG